MLNNFMYEVTSVLTELIVWLTTGLTEDNVIGIMDTIKYYHTYDDIMNTLSLPIWQISIITIMAMIAFILFMNVLTFITKLFIKCDESKGLD